MAIDTRAEAVNAFYRLTGTSATDQAFIEHDTSTLESLYGHLTHGFRQAQLFLIDNGLPQFWLKRSAALTWSGTEASDGGRWSALPSDFLRAWGDDDTRSSLVEADGSQWGQEIRPEEKHRRGGFYYFAKNPAGTAFAIWIAKGAVPPTSVYLQYVYEHPEITSSTTTLDLPDIAVRLGVAEAAHNAKNESWLPGGPEMKADIASELREQRAVAKAAARPSRSARRMREQAAFGPRWFIRR